MTTKIFRLLIAVGLCLSVSNPYASQAASNAKGPTYPCSKSGQVVHMNAMIYKCVKSGKKYSWSKGVPEQKTQSPTQSGSSNGSSQTSTPSDKTFLYMKRIGMSCSTNGVFGFSGGMITICKNNMVKYALPSDIPPTPAGGYKKRPNWYPTLAQQLGHLSEPTCAPSTIKFTSPVIPLVNLAPSIPYGAMLGGHVTPIDHAYLGVSTLFKDPATRTEADYVPVTSPADGTITSLQNLGSPTSIRVVIEHGCNVSTVYMVLNRLAGVLASYAQEMSASGASKGVSIPIKAGQVFGIQRDNPLDFNVWDGTQWLSGFANPFSYATSEAWKPYTADPLPFFSPTIQSAMAAVMQKTTQPRIGKIDYDKAGAASGNWFLDGTFGYSGYQTSFFQSASGEIPGGAVPGKNYYSWSHLAIAPHEVDQSKWIFSTGWWKDENGDPQQFLLKVATGQPTPDTLTKTSGIVVYQLMDYSTTEPAGAPLRTPGSNAPLAVGYTLGEGALRGVVALQVNSDDSLSVEINTSITEPSQFTSFTTSKRIYRR